MPKRRNDVRCHTYRPRQKDDPVDPVRKRWEDGIIWELAGPMLVVAMEDVRTALEANPSYSRSGARWAGERSLSF